MIKTNLIGSMQEALIARYDELKVNAFVHQQEFEEQIQRRQLKESKVQYAESIIYLSQSIAVLDVLEIMFGLSDDQRAERKESYRVIERNLVRVEALRHDLSQTVRAL